MDIRTAMMAASSHLEAGEPGEAEVELRSVLRVEPSHREAQNLLRQITEDPVTVLGRESFAYRVQPGESLSAIAGRFLKDPMLFYALARYNGIKVPRQLAGGQTIRVPGKSPPPAPPAPASAATTPPAPASAVAPPAPAASAARAPATIVGQHVRAARACAAKQDLCCAVSNWNKVLEIDPNHATARLERQKALDLIERLRGRGAKLEC